MIASIILGIILAFFVFLFWKKGLVHSVSREETEVIVNGKRTKYVKKVVVNGEVKTDDHYEDVDGVWTDMKGKGKNS